MGFRESSGRVCSSFLHGCWLFKSGQGGENLRAPSGVSWQDASHQSGGSVSVCQHGNMAESEAWKSGHSALGYRLGSHSTSQISWLGLRTRRGKVALKFEIGAKGMKLTCSCLTRSYLVNKNQANASQSDRDSQEILHLIRQSQTLL